jgi:indolepyruvate ferredoxin oxidoreductase, beta subunit
VDVLIAAEMMEVGRAILRGFVTPDRTALIGSTHRALAVSEKMAPGDGIANSDRGARGRRSGGARAVPCGFRGGAVGAGSVISASLFGALGRVRARCPFRATAFEAAIRARRQGGGGQLARLCRRV